MSNNIEERAMLVTLSISQWSAARGDKRTAGDAVKAQYGASKAQYRSGRDLGRFTKYLIDPEALAHGSKIAAAARTEHYRITLSYSDDGARIISAAGYGRYMETMRDFEVKFFSWYNDEFKPQYPQYVADAKAALSAGFVASEYPDITLVDVSRGTWHGSTPTTALDRKFAFSVTPSPVPAASHFAGLIGVTQGELETIRRTAMNDANARIVRAVDDIWTRLEAVVSNMAERLKAFGTPLTNEDGEPTGKTAFFLDSLVTNVSDLLDIVPILNFTSNSEIDATASRIRAELTKYSPQILRASSTIRVDVARSAEAVLGTMRGMRRIVARKAA